VLIQIIVSPTSPAPQALPLGFTTQAGVVAIHGKKVRANGAQIVRTPAEVVRPTQK